MGGRIRYAYLEDEAVVFDDDQAFRLHAGEWMPLHLADAMSKAKLLTPAEFKRYLPAGAPPSPIT